MSDNRRPRLIGCAGFSRVGKDEACRLLGGHRLAFADALKADLAPVIRDRYGFDPTALTPEQKETLRPLFVAHGAAARAVDPDIWIRPVEERIRGFYDMAAAGQWAPPLVCVTDVRYLNEVNAVLKLGGMVVHITRPGYGPANGEEERSFDLIRLRWARGDFGLAMRPVDNSGDLVEFAQKLKEAIG